MPEQAAADESGMREMTVEATMENIETVTDFVNQQLTEHGCTEKAMVQLDVAIDEVFGNIVRHAYGAETGTATVRVWMEEVSGIIHITFMDQGQPFNPLEKEMPDTTRLKARERPIGGLGLFMLKRTMDNMTYDYQDGKNILTIEKRIR